MYRALDCGLTAEAFWDASPRAIYEIYECAKTARKPAAGAAKGNRARPKQAATGAAPRGPRLSRIPR